MERRIKKKKKISMKMEVGDAHRKIYDGHCMKQ
jgi:hypothetical protein